MRPWMQAAGEYAGLASRSSETSSEGTGSEGLDRALNALASAWETATGFALEHPVLAVVSVLLVGLLAERLLARRSWRY